MDQKDKGLTEGGRGQNARYSELAGKFVRSAWRDVHASPRAELSPRVIGAVASELRACRRRRRYGQVLRWTGGACAGAALVIGALGLLSSHRRQPQKRVDAVVVAGNSVPPNGFAESGTTGGARVLVVLEDASATRRSLLPRRVVGWGDTFRAGAQTPVRIGSAAGTELVVEPGGSLRVLDADTTKRFALLRGAVHMRVAKLLPGERFIIETSHTKVEVHGTQFRVSLVDAVPGCEGIVTKVSVSEGIVGVDSDGQQANLVPGDEWVSQCAPSPALPPDQQASRRELARRRAHSRAPLVAAPADDRAAPPSASQLAAQNDLFASAIRAKRNRRDQDALARFERFVRQFPDSSLIESALVHRMRLLARSDGVAGVEAARGYLLRFPDGFAREEAHLLIIALGKP